MQSKMIINTGLFHDTVGDVPDFDDAIYRNISAGNRAVPNIVIALTPAHEIAAIFPQNLANPFFILCHLRQNRLGFHFEQQMNSRMRHIVEFQHFRHGEFHPADKNVNGIILKNYGNIVILGIPSLRFISKRDGDYIFVHEASIDEKRNNYNQKTRSKHEKHN